MLFLLHLSLGAVNLNLLGLVVNLNNCATPAGPVTVDITAQSGPVMRRIKRCWKVK